MPRLRRLSGPEVLRILRKFGFEVWSQKGSHVRLQRITPAGDQQRLLVAVHGHKAIPIGTLTSIYKAACEFIPEDDLRPHFFAD